MGFSKWQDVWTETSFIFWLHTHNLWLNINSSLYVLFSSLGVYQCNRCFLSLIMSTLGFLPSITNFSSSNNLDMNRLCDKKRQYCILVYLFTSDFWLFMNHKKLLLSMNRYEACIIYLWGEKMWVSFFHLSIIARRERASEEKNMKAPICFGLLIPITWIRSVCVLENAMSQLAKDK